MPDQTPEHNNEFDGRADWVFQARNIGGNVYIQPSRRPAEPPRQVFPPSRHFTNNEAQLDKISAALRRIDPHEPGQPAVVVVTGTPGGGKSETVYQAVAIHGEDFPDGQFYVSLRAGSGELLPALRSLLTSVGYDRSDLPDSAGDCSSWFRTWTTDKRVLVVIDDASSPAQVRPLLPASGHSAVLITASGPLEGLRARSEVTFVDLDPMEDGPARLLLARIADQVDLEREPDQVDELIRLCEGSTIALCVTGALLAAHPDRPIRRLVGELAREGRRLGRLSLDSELSVTMVLNTAVDRLSPETRRCYLAFGQHPGTGDVGVPALADALDQDADDVRDALEALLSAKLIRETSDERFMTFGLVRDHAKDRAEQDETVKADAERISQRFEQFYFRWALAAGHTLMPGRPWLGRLWPNLIPGDGMLETTARDWLERQRSTLRAVTERLHTDGRVETCQLAVALWPLHERGKHLDDMDTVNRLAAEVADHVGDLRAHSLAVTQRGFAFRHLGQFDKAAELFETSRALAKESGQSDLDATALESLGLVRREQGDQQQARELLRHNLEMAETIGDPRRSALAAMHLGSVQPPAEALPLLDSAAEEFRSSAPPDEYNAAKVALWRGKKLTELERFADAARALEQAHEHMVAENRHFDVAQVHHALGELSLATADRDRARQHLTEALAIFRTWGFSEQAERVRARLTELDGD